MPILLFNFQEKSTKDANPPFFCRRFSIDSFSYEQYRLSNPIINLQRVFAQEPDHSFI